LISLEIAGKVRAVHGIDISPKMVAIATKKAADRGISNVGFSVQDAYSLPFEDNCFDVVLAPNVLHIMIEPERALREIYRVLKKEGIFCAPTYCHGQSLFSGILSRLMGIAGFRAYHRWSSDTFAGFIEMNNFHITDSMIVKDKIPLFCFKAVKK